MSGVVRSSLSSSSGPWESSNSTTLYISTVGYLHQALLPSSSTTPGAYLWYQVGDGVGNWSSVFNATPVSARGLVQETYAVYGDFGWGNNVSMQYLIQDAQAGEFDSVLHVGDFAYNFDTDKCVALPSSLVRPMCMPHSHPSFYPPTACAGPTTEITS